VSAVNYAWLDTTLEGGQTRAYYTETTCIANSAGKLCIADPLHSSLHDRHCSSLVSSSQMIVLKLTSDAERSGKLSVERHNDDSTKQDWISLCLERKKKSSGKFRTGV
jgi:hypothetical protein